MSDSSSDVMDVSDAFIRNIINDARRGMSFIPLIGSGFSAPSGILMGLDFAEYLAFTVYCVLCNPTEKQFQIGLPRRHWNLHEEGWPHYPDRREADAALAWVRKQFGDLCERCGFVRPDPDSNAIESLAPNLSVPNPDRILQSFYRPLIPAVIRSPKAADAEAAAARFMRILEFSDQERADLSQPALSLTSYEHVVERGIRALHDWRHTLEFLGQIRITEAGPVIDKLHRSIIDSFNANITRDKQPNLGHKMLAHLAEPLRIRTVLTTNFDTLLEQAFSQFALELRVLPVGVKGHLPDHRTVRAQNSLVKLHGELMDTRADLTLDDEPSVEDKARFAAYFGRGRHGERAPAAHMLVIGYSASDPRCVKLVKHVLDVSQGQFTVYWVCHSRGDMNHLQSIFPEREYSNRLQQVLSPRPDLLLYELYQRLMFCLPPGGLTYEFTHNVPAERRPRFSFDLDVVQRTADVVIEEGDLIQAARRTLRHAAPQENIYKLCRDVLVQEITAATVHAITHHATVNSPVRDWFRLAPDPQASRVWTLRVAGGAVRILRDAYEKIAAMRGCQCVWFELRDYAAVEDLARDIMRVLALRSGYFQRHHCTLYPLAEALATENESALVEGWTEMCRELRLTPHNCTIILYGRDTPGTCAGWLDEPWGAENTEKLAVLRRALGRVGFSVLYVPLEKHRLHRKWERARGAIVTPHAPPEQRDYLAWRESLEEDNWKLALETAEVLPDDFNVEDQAAKISVYEHEIADVQRFFPAVRPTDMPQDEWNNKLRFLYAMTLFRQSRHPSALYAEGVFRCPYRYNILGLDNDWARSEAAQRWIRQLQQCRAMFLKPGGYAWVHDDVRLGLQRWLDHLTFDPMESRPSTAAGGTVQPGAASVQAPNPTAPTPAAPATAPSELDFLAENRARTHFWIGDWYFKAYAASGHITPTLESLYHRYQAILYAAWARPTSSLSRTDAADADALFRYRAMLVRSSLMEILKTLEIARPSIKLWLGNALGHTMFDVNEVGKFKQGLTDAFNRIVAAAGRTAKKSPATRRAKASANSDWLESSISALIEDVGAAITDVARAIQSEGITSAARYYHMPFTSELHHIPSGTVNSLGIDAPPEILYADELSEPKSNSIGSRLRAAFQSCQGESIIDEVLSENSRVESSMLSKAKAVWILDRRAQFRSADVHTMVWLLSEAGYLLVRRAKVEYHATDNIPWIRWRQVCMACNTGIDLCKHLHPAYLHEEVAAKAKLHAIYAMGLANLGRFAEAHRHLNEAHALVLKAPSQRTAVERGILCLRRAEVYLTLCHWIHSILIEGAAASDQKAGDAIPHHFEWGGRKWRFDQHPVTLADHKGLDRLNDLRTNPEKCELPEPLREIFADAKNLEEWTERRNAFYVATLDDAWNELDRAEVYLGGNSQSTLWWGRLATLRLRAYGRIPRPANESEKSKKLALKLLLFRKENGEDGIARWFRVGMRIVGSDRLRQIRLVDYFLRAVAEFKQVNQISPGASPAAFAAEMKQAFKILSDATNEAPRYPLLAAYLNKVKLLRP